MELKVNNNSILKIIVVCNEIYYNFVLKIN